MQFARTADDVTAIADEAIDEAQRLLDAVVTAESPTWTSTMAPLEDLLDTLGQADGRAAFMGYVHPDAEVREAGRAVDQRLQQWQVAMVHRRDLYEAITAYAATDEAAELSGERARALRFALRDLRRAGHELDESAREELREHSDRLVEIGVEFQRNLAEHDDPMVVTDEDLAGLPASYVEGLATGPEEGTYLVTLAYPDALPFLEQAQRRDLRRELDRRFHTQAEDANRALLGEAVRLRARMARLHGVPSWAHHQLEVRMAGHPGAVEEMYDGIVPPLQATARDELTVMRAMLAEDLGATEQDDDGPTVQRYDWRYYHTRLLREQHGVDRDEVAAHFPLDQVIDGLFTLTGDVFGIDHERIEAETWHDDVRTYRIRDRASGEPVATVHMDLFPREGTYGHAAAFTLRSGRRLPDGTYQEPVSAIRANFTRPSGDRPSLLQHGEVETLFHEYGHILHQVLTRAELVRFAGTRVERDFVEAPSQIMQHWTWDPAVLRTFARHHETGAPIPDELVDRLVEARNLDVALHTLRQVQFGLLDMALHGPEAPDLDLDEVARRTAEVTLLPTPPDTFYPSGFGHLVGGYDAGYYGYLWAEIIGDDMFRRFAEEGPTSPEVGGDYRREILEVGGTRDAEDSVRAFLGREPDNTAFLHKLGISPT